MLSRGRLEIDFRSVEHLAENLLMLAQVLESEGEQFTEAFEPRLSESAVESDDSYLSV